MNRQIIPVILYRDFDIEKTERDAIEENFIIYNSRTSLGINCCNSPNKQLVIGRYSVLPFYKELINDLTEIGATLINSWEQHSFVANIGQWYPVIKEWTPETWSMSIGTNNLPNDCSFVLKGATNSIKRLWTTHMFARSRIDVPDVYGRLLDDTMIGQQEIFARRYIPLRKLGESINGMPVTEEYRFFICYGKILSSGYYWSSHKDEIKVPTGSQYTAYITDFVKLIANLIGNKCNFYTIDIGIKEDGSPIVIELNDGQMAGLSENDPFILYKNLKDIINKKTGKAK